MLPCKFLLATFQLKFDHYNIFFFSFNFHCPLRAHPFHRGEKDVRAVDTLPLARAVSGTSGGISFPVAERLLLWLLLGKDGSECWVTWQRMSCGSWTWWGLGSSPWPAAPSPSFSTEAAQCCSLPLLHGRRHGCLAGLRVSCSMQWAWPVWGNVKSVY